MDTIEELKQQIATLQSQLQEQQKLAGLGMLVAGIAHEVQNPLNFVINFSKMSFNLVNDIDDIIGDIDDSGEAPNPADLEEMSDICADLMGNMKKIQEHGERAISIIRSILLQSRGKAGEFLPTDVAALVHEYVWLSYHAMRANDKSFNVSIHEDYPGQLPKLMVIPQDLCRAVLNIVNNAFYTIAERTAREQSAANGPGSANTPDSAYAPQLTVSVRYADGILTIVIADNGMGMDDATRQHLFENFFTTKPAGKGTGLGMGIVRHIIIDEHHGEMQVDSAPLQGTTITFVIPAKPC